MGDEQDKARAQELGRMGRVDLLAEIDGLTKRLVQAEMLTAYAARDGKRAEARLEAGEAILCEQDKIIDALVMVCRHIETEMEQAWRLYERLGEGVDHVLVSEHRVHPVSLEDGQHLLEMFRTATRVRLQDEDGREAGAVARALPLEEPLRGVVADYVYDGSATRVGIPVERVAMHEDVPCAWLTGFGPVPLAVVVLRVVPVEPQEERRIDDAHKEETHEAPSALLATEKGATTENLGTEAIAAPQGDICGTSLGISPEDEALGHKLAYLLEALCAWTQEVTSALQDHVDMGTERALKAAVERLVKETLRLTHPKSWAMFEEGKTPHGITAPCANPVCSACGRSDDGPDPIGLWPAPGPVDPEVRAKGERFAVEAGRAMGSLPNRLLVEALRGPPGNPWNPRCERCGKGALPVVPVVVNAEPLMRGSGFEATVVIDPDPAEHEEDTRG